MNIFESLNFNEESLTKFLEGQAKSKGVLSRSKHEILERVEVLYRPFRKITWSLEKLRNSEQCTSVSYIDEVMSPIVGDRDHRFLLWRPRYANLKVLNSEDVKQQYSENTSLEAIQNVIDELILNRWRGQELDEELRPTLRSLQADPLAAIALIIPRSPYGMKREEELIQERKELHSFVLASSLVTNCSQKDIVVSAEIGDSVSVETLVARYRDTSTEESRLLFLEMSGADSLQGAKKQGSALSRVCTLYANAEVLFQNV
ncbi:MAG: hypothetical protein ACFFEK_05385 [Candidatus Thorarchaeota archaeon]